MISLTPNPIDVSSILESVSTPQSGGIDMFVGTTRNIADGKEVTLLDYEAYEPMALSVMKRLESDARKRWSLHRIAIVHRLGKVQVSEASVVIAVSCSHRKEAFEACRFLIDALKKEVPIWKTEHFIDGTAVRSGSTEFEKERMADHG